MKVTLLPSTAGDAREDQEQFLTSYLLNDSIAIDAGCLGFWGTPQEQARIKHVFLTHSHIDHLASLPILVDNVYDSGGDCVTIHAAEPVLAALRSDVFNDRIWPDFVALSQNNAKPFLQLNTIAPGKPVLLEGLRITGVPVHHVVPTLGFVIDDGTSAVVISSDTGPTDALWQHANALPNLKAVFLEVTFPERMAALAKVSAHLTPALFAKELRKLKNQVPVIAVHIKARFRAEVIKELQSLAIPNLHIGKFGTAYCF